MTAASVGHGGWFVAVTTAPRDECTLRTCVESLRGAGWEPTVFAEPGSTVVDAETIQHDSRQGVWRNWLQSARYAIEQTTAKLILTVQDDTVFHPDSRDFVESILWPADDAGFVSLYTPKHYSQRTRSRRLRPVGVNRIRTHSPWGACALAWPRDVLEQLIEHPVALNWTGAAPRSRDPRVLEERQRNPETIANSDTAIGKLMNTMRRSMWFIDPSPVEHIAKHSTIGHGGNTGRRNCVRRADHSRPLAEQVFPPDAK